MSPQRLPQEVPLESSLRNNHEQPQEVVQIDDEVESDQSYSLSDSDEDEYMDIDLSDFKELHCPICLGIIRKTAVVMECMHRFCRKCIEKSLRLSNNECPVCRVHCPSRRFLRDDPNYDALITTFVPNIDEYEKQEDDSATHVYERTPTKEEIQASDAPILLPPTEELDKKQKARAIAIAFERKRRSVEKDLSSGDNENTQTMPGDGEEQEIQFPQESVIVSSSRNGHHRSDTRVNGENAKSNRLSRFIDYLHNSDTNHDELEIPLALVSLDGQKIASLQEPFLSCRPTVSVKILSKYVALKVEVLADQVGLYLVEESQANILRGELTVDPDKDKLRILGDEETLAELYTWNVTNSGYLLLAYKMK